MEVVRAKRVAANLVGTHCFYFLPAHPQNFSGFTRLKHELLRRVRKRGAKRDEVALLPRFRRPDKVGKEGFPDDDIEAHFLLYLARDRPFRFLAAVYSAPRHIPELVPDALREQDLTVLLYDRFVGDLAYEML